MDQESSTNIHLRLEKIEQKLNQVIHRLNLDLTPIPPVPSATPPEKSTTESSPQVVHTPKKKATPESPLKKLNSIL